MKKNKLRRALALTLSVLMVLTVTPVSAAAGKVLLSKKTVSLEKGKSETVKVKATGGYKFKKAVVRKNSNKKIAKITIKKNKVTIKGLEEGSANVTLKASYNKKTQTKTKNLTLSVRVTGKNVVDNTPAPAIPSSTNAVVNPHGTTTPNVAITPGSTTAPKGTVTPGGTATPKGTVTPGSTTTPKATVTPGSTATPKATATPEATTIPGSDVYELTSYGIYLSNKLPYNTNGLTITNITFDSYNKVYVEVKNNTGAAINSSSCISYKCYDSSDVVTKTGKLYLEDINNGESCNALFYKTSDTVKVIFDGSSVKNGSESEYQEMTRYGSYLSNSLPYETNGLSMTNIEFDSYNKVYVTVKNNTGAAIDSASNISYKCYDSSDVVTKTGKLYLENINNGETCRVLFYKTSDTVKVIFDNSTVREGTESKRQETTAYGTYFTNVLPYETNGLLITDIEFDSYNKVYVTVKNNTGAAINSASNISYKCYDSSEVVTKTGKLYLEDVNNGETCRVLFYKTSDTIKVVFFDSSVK